MNILRLRLASSVNYKSWYLILSVTVRALVSICDKRSTTFWVKGMSLSCISSGVWMSSGKVFSAQLTYGVGGVALPGYRALERFGNNGVLPSQNVGRAHALHIA